MALAIHAADSFTREGNAFLAQAIFTNVRPPARKPSRWQRFVAVMNTKIF